MLNALRRSGERRRLSDAILKGLVARARLEIFYRDWGVADTIDGRFDMLVLHAWLALDRIAEDRALSQALVDALFVQFDEALREQGAGDIGMGRRMTKMADAFFGRLQAYRAATDRAALAGVIHRNVYRSNELRVEQADRLAIYALAARDHLAAGPFPDGAPDFGEPVFA